MRSGKLRLHCWVIASSSSSPDHHPIALAHCQRPLSPLAQPASQRGVTAVTVNFTEDRDCELTMEERITHLLGLDSSLQLV